MNGKKYLVYLDILGFEILAEEIEEERGIESREVREKFIDVRGCPTIQNPNKKKLR